MLKGASFVDVEAISINKENNVDTMYDNKSTMEYDKRRAAMGHNNLIGWHYRYEKYTFFGWLQKITLVPALPIAVVSISSKPIASIAVTNKRKPITKWRK